MEIFTIIFVAIIFIVAISVKRGARSSRGSSLDSGSGWSPFWDSGGSDLPHDHSSDNTSHPHISHHDTHHHDGGNAGVLTTADPTVVEVAVVLTEAEGTIDQRQQAQSMNEPQNDLGTAPNRFARLAAVTSMVTPLVAIFSYVILFLFIKSNGHANFAAMGILGFLVLMLMLLGLVLGVTALVITKRHQRKGIFGKALIGICLNGVFLALLVVVPLVLMLVAGSKVPETSQGRLDAAVKKLAEAGNDQDRFYALNRAAKESFNAGKIDDANNFAKELLKLAPKFQGDWNYGNAIQDGNLVLGRIAVRDGRIEEAKIHLLEAGKSPGSPQMDSFGPNMSLANDLVQKGERDTVLQYFELCRKFWSMDYGKLNQWRDEVKAGKTPDFGANLVY